MRRGDARAARLSRLLVNKGRYSFFSNAPGLAGGVGFDPAILRVWVRFRVFWKPIGLSPKSREPLGSDAPHWVRSSIFPALGSISHFRIIRLILRIKSRGAPLRKPFLGSILKFALASFSRFFARL
jgi:hypothetical protein